MKISASKRVDYRLFAIVLSLLLATVAVLFSSLSATKAAAPVDQLVGYGAGTTGGNGGSTVTVSSLSAFQSAVSGSSAKIVKVQGMLSGTGQIDVGSNTTVLGVGSNSGFNGVGLRLKGVTNVIIRNLTISKVVGTDAITIINGTTRVWVDHNDLSSDLSHDKDYYDGLLDITHAADYITVSWNRFHDHYKGSLIGHSDSNASEDTGHLHVTYHHNWFNNVNSRLPSIRFGTGHIYNNLYENAATSGINSRMGAQVLVESNVFNNVKLAITTDLDSSQQGYAVSRNNIFNNSTTNITQVGSFSSAPYSYPLDDASSVASIVKASSGVGVINGGGSTNPTPTPTTPGSTPTPTTPGTTPTPTPTSPSTGSVYQAENAALSNASVKTQYSGYTGTGYVSYGGPGGWIEWTVNVPSSGSYSLAFRYSNETSNNRPQAVDVDGNRIKDNLTFKSTGNASTWSTAQQGASLTAGTHKIRLTANSLGGNNIDYLQLIAG